MRAVRSLVHAWLVLDFFGDARRRGGAGSTLTTTIFTQAFLALVFAALLYPETPPVAFAAANLCLSSLLVAVGTLGDQNRLDRRRADQTLLGTSPTPAMAIAGARAGHAAFYVCLITAGMALPPAILLAFLKKDPMQVAGYVAAACVSSGLAVGVLAVTLRLLARCFGHDRAALLAGSLKAVLLGAGIAFFALGLQRLRGTAADLPIGRLGAELLPPYHTARLLAEPVAEAWRLGALGAVAALLFLLAIAAGEREEDSARRGRVGGPLRAALLRIAGRGPRLGLSEFVAAAMWRSPSFRSRVLPLLGLPAGMVYLSLQGEKREHSFVFVCVLLQLPAIYLPFLIAFLPRADQENTRWLFDQAPPLELTTIRDATWRALVTHVLLPVHGLAAVLLVTTTGKPLDAAVACLFAFGVGVLAARPMCRGLCDVPFTEDGNSEPATDLGALFPFALALLALAITFGAFFSTPIRWAAAAVVLLAAAYALHRTPPVVAGEPTGGSAPPIVGVTAEVPPVDSTQTSTDERDADASAIAEASLGRELRAIGVLYLAVSLLPVLVGLALSP